MDQKTKLYIAVGFGVLVLILIVVAIIVHLNGGNAAPIATGAGAAAATAAAVARASRDDARAQVKQAQTDGAAVKDAQKGAKDEMAKVEGDVKAESRDQKKKEGDDLFGGGQ